MPFDITQPQPSNAMRRIGSLDSHCWQAKLYAGQCFAGVLSTEDRIISERACRAAIVTGTRVVGFALIRSGAGPETLSIAAFWWEGTRLYRAALLLDRSGRLPRRDDAGCVGTVEELLLIGREAAAWDRAGSDARHDRYMAECCA